MNTFKICTTTILFCYGIQLCNAWSFFSIGDSGGWGNAVWTKIDGKCLDGRTVVNADMEPTQAQIRVAEGMAKLSRQLGEKPKFIASLGDLFYYYGVGPLGVKDPVFDTMWGDIYTQKELQVPFHIISGNHDWGHDNSNIEQPTSEELASVGLSTYNPPNRGNVPALIQYSLKQKFKLGSKRWVYKDYNYATPIQHIGNGKTFQIIYFDYIILNGDDGEFGRENTWNNYTPILSKEWSEKTLRWIERKLKKSTADYLFLGAHVGVWGDDNVYDQIYPLLVKYKAHIINSHGHYLTTYRKVTDDWTVYDIAMGVSGNVNYDDFNPADPQPGDPELLMYYFKGNATLDGLITDVNGESADYPTCWTSDMTNCTFGGFSFFGFDERLYSQTYVTGFDDGDILPVGPRIEFEERCISFGKNINNYSKKIKEEKQNCKNNKQSCNRQVISAIKKKIKKQKKMFGFCDSTDN